MRGANALEPASIDVTATQRQLGALEQVTAENFQTIREVAGSADASFSFGPRASRPASGAQGDRYLATDIGTIGGWLYYYTGTAWEIVVGWASGTNAVRAAISVTSVDNGAWFYTSDTAKFWEVSGGSWVDRTPSIAAASEAFVTIGNTAGLSAERALTGTANQVTITDNGAGSTVVVSLPTTVSITTAYQVGGTQVVAARRTGWAASAGSATRTGFDTTTATLTQVAEHLKALIDDLIAHGLIGT